MGEAGQIVLMPGMGKVQPLFQNRGLAFQKKDEKSTPYVYEVLLNGTQLIDRDWNATAEAAEDGPDPGKSSLARKNRTQKKHHLTLLRL